MTADLPALRAIGYVESLLTDPARAPRQPDEGSAPPAILRIEPQYAAALDGLHEGTRVLVITWLRLADRDTLVVHPRGDRRRRRTGVFATRAPGRPNPIGLHETTIASVHPDHLVVDHLEAIDGTPILDVKPVLGPPANR